MWDEYMQTDAVRKLLAHLRKLIQALCTEVTAIANKHFNSYIKSTYPRSYRPRANAPPPATFTPITPASSATPSHAIVSPRTTYAQVAAINGPLKAPLARKL